MTDPSWIIVSCIMGIVGTILYQSATGGTPFELQNKLCTEANWQLPSCKEYLDKGIKQLKGEKL